MSFTRALSLSMLVSLGSAQDVFLAARSSADRTFIGEIRWHGQQDTCMDVAGGRSDNGNKMQVWRCTGSVNQQFSYNPDEWMPQIKWMGHPGKCLDVHYGNTGNFADVVLYDCHP